jgi:ABC-2 type transport system ATP-binding protein
VGIAQALIGSPEVIIFDEPTVGLDPKQIIEVRNLLRNLGRDHTVILSTHILQEVQAVCDRIVIINKGKIVADELTENITRAVENTRRFQVKICGPQKEVLSMLRSKSGIVSAEVLSQRDGDAYTYTIESEVGVDICKNLFYSLVEKNWPMIGMEALGMSLEDIFIAIVDQSSSKKKYERRSSKSRTKVEQEIASSILEKTSTQETSALFGSDDEQQK